MSLRFQSKHRNEMFEAVGNIQSSMKLIELHVIYNVRFYLKHTQVLMLNCISKDRQGGNVN